MALYFGSQLATTGVDVQLLGTWKEGVEAVHRDGICLEDGGEKNHFQARATMEESKLAPVDLALVLVKSWQTIRAADQLSRLLTPDGVVLTLQNGLGNAEILQKQLGQDRVAQGVTTYGATLLGPGKVRPGGEGIITIQDHPRLNTLLQIFQKCGLKTQVVSDLTGLVWGKLVINVGINPLTALLEVKNGQLLESPQSIELMGLAAREAAAVAQKLDISLNFDDPVKAVMAVAEATAGNMSSMLQDIKRGAPTEIEALCGEVIRWGEAVNLPTPVNQLLYLLIKAKVELNKGQFA
jgi:2-dehydropantoate 2-reductase